MDDHITVRFLRCGAVAERQVAGEPQSTPLLLLEALRGVRNGASCACSRQQLMATYRWDQLVSVGRSVGCCDASATLAAADDPPLTQLNPRTQYAHAHVLLDISSPIRNDDDEDAIIAVVDRARQQFVAHFRSRADSELDANGDFRVVVSADFRSAELFAALGADPPPVPVVLDHDGGVDDLLALLVLASTTVRPLDAMARRIELIGTVIVDADCFAKPAGELCRRLFAMFHAVSPDGICQLPVGVSPLPGTAHPFPDEWRKDCIAMLDLPCLHTAAVDAAFARRPREQDGSGHELLARLVMESPRPVTIVVTGPLTNVAWALRTHKDAFARNVREISIMGGAVHVDGNVINANLPKDAVAVDGSAEWNIYWDAPAAHEVLQSPLLRHKLLYSLDATNHVPVTSDFVRRFGKVTLDPVAGLPTQLANFCASSWAQTTFLQHLFGNDRGYFAWDVLCAVGILVPDIARYTPTNVRVVVGSGDAAEGRTVVDDLNGSRVHVARKIDAEAFYKYVLESAALC